MNPQNPEPNQNPTPPTPPTPPEPNAQPPVQPAPQPAVPETPPVTPVQIQEVAQPTPVQSEPAMPVEAATPTEPVTPPPAPNSQESVANNPEVAQEAPVVQQVPSTEVPPTPPQTNTAQTGTPPKKVDPKTLVKPVVITGLAFVVVAAVTFAVMRLVGGSSVALAEYSNQDLGITVSYPEGWQIDDTFAVDNQGIIKFTEPDVEGDTSEFADQKANLSVDVSRAGGQAKQTSEEFFDEIESSVKQIFDAQQESEDNEYGELLSASMTKVGDYDAYQVEVTIHNFEGEPGVTASGKISFIYINDKTAVTITVQGHESDKKFVDTFESILDSFSVNE